MAGDGGHVPSETPVAARGGAIPERCGHPHPNTPDSTRRGGSIGCAQSSNPKRTRTHTLTPPLFQLLYAPIYQAPRLSPAGTPVALRPLGAR